MRPDLVTGRATPGTSDQIAYLRSRHADRPLQPYEALMVSDKWRGSTHLAAGIMEKGWQVANLPRVRLDDPPIAWDEVCAANRSAHYHLHAWEPLGPILSAYEHTRELGFLEFAVAVAVDWATSFPTPETASPFAWYDMAIGLRAYRLGYLLDAASRCEEIPDSSVAVLLESAALHRDQLADDRNFVENTNHGFYQAAGQLALAVRFAEMPGMPQAREQATSRLYRLIAAQFDVDEGVHREHSPGYHSLVLSAFDRVLSTGLTDDRALFELRERIEEALAWFVLPNGSFAMFGDSPHAFSHSAEPEEVSSEALRFVLSRGRAGTPPGAPARTFPGSGYVVFRDRWPDGPDDFENCSYLAQTCAFHSRAHKHADDLSFVWFDRGQELLTDAGRYGYLGKTTPDSDLWQDGFWYSDPKRAFVESTQAHNTVEIDGRSYNRRRTTPYGSALLQAGEQDGVFYSEARVSHDRIQHTRVLLFSPGRWLVVFDCMQAGRLRSHEYVQRFQFAPALELSAEGDVFISPLTGSDDALYVVPLLEARPVAPVRGQNEPGLQGWISLRYRELTPRWTAGYAQSGTGTTVFATLLTFGRSAPAPVADTNRVDSQGRAARFGWTVDGRHHEIGFQRAPGTRFRLRERSTD
jgi:hypothetical protein